MKVLSARYAVADLPGSSETPAEHGMVAALIPRGQRATCRRVPVRGQVVRKDQGSIVHLECSGVMLFGMHNRIKLLEEHKPRRRLMQQRGAACAAHGTITLAGSRMCASMADHDEVLDDALAHFDQVFAQVVEV